MELNLGAESSMKNLVQEVGTEKCLSVSALMLQ